MNENFIKANQGIQESPQSGLEEALSQGVTVDQYIGGLERSLEIEKYTVLESSLIDHNMLEELKAKNLLDSSFNNKDTHQLELKAMSRGQALRQYGSARFDTSVLSEHLEYEILDHTQLETRLDIAITKFNEGSTTEEILKQIEDLGLRPITYDELIQFAFANPDYQKKNNLIALGSLFNEDGVPTAAAATYGAGSHALIALYSDKGWSSDCRFPVTSK